MEFDKHFVSEGGGREAAILDNLDRWMRNASFPRPRLIEMIQAKVVRDRTHLGGRGGIKWPRFVIGGLGQGSSGGSRILIGGRHLLFFKGLRHWGGESVRNSCDDRGSSKWGWKVKTSSLLMPARKKILRCRSGLQIYGLLAGRIPPDYFKTTISLSTENWAPKTGKKTRASPEPPWSCPERFDPRQRATKFPHLWTIGPSHQINVNDFTTYFAKSSCMPDPTSFLSHVMGRLFSDRFYTTNNDVFYFVV